EALVREFRFTFRAAEKGRTDFLEGVRAQIIDKDRSPRWQHAAPEEVTAEEVAALLAPLGEDELRFADARPLRVGFIGLGNMGAPMAANLVKAGHRVAGFDVTGQMPAGVTPADSAAAAARGADVVITMLPNGAILRAVAAEVIPA